jgi:DNA-binding CsgD family transcriptional regulator
MAESTHLHWPAGTAARCRGLLDLDGRADRHFEQSLEWLSPTMSFERARTELAFAEWLLAQGRPRRARDLLIDAAGFFERAGARHWSRRAAAALAELGGGPSGLVSPIEVLTSHEMEVARLVAGGATNREAAAELFITEKTVEFHLGKIYRKLGIRSRLRLAQWLADVSSSGPGRPRAPD